MSQSRYKYPGKDAAKSEPKRQPYPKKDVELCLEVEMDDEVREIITSPEKCTSTLLDVTVIKPIDLDQLYSSHQTTLNGDEVRKLIASMELEKQDKQKLLDRLLAMDQSKSSGDYVKKRFIRKSPTLAKGETQKISTTDDTNSDFTSSYQQKNIKRNMDKVQHIYTSPKTYNDIKSIFTCKNRYRQDDSGKSGGPCLCRNCAIVGVLTDSQKKPFITENLQDPTELLSNRKDKRKKNVNFKDDTDDHVECEFYFRHLSAKIRRLEERLALQEERSVQRDYFKRIITKLVTHLSRFTGYEPPQGRPKSKDSKEKHKKERYTDNRYYVQSVMIDPKAERPELESDDLFPVKSHLDVSNRLQQTSESFWKWGEEILKPGIDLKNKIVLLLEETLNNLKKTRSFPSKLGGCNNLFVPTEAPQKLSEVPERDVTTNKANGLACKNCPLLSHNNAGGASIRPKVTKSSEKRSRKVVYTKHDTPEGGVSVSYLNPKMRKWQEESMVSFKLDSSDMDSGKSPEDKRLNESYKSDFKETLSRTKDPDKLRLWQSVWTQAKLNGQTKDDKVTIQLPERRNPKGNKTIEIEYTIAELEDLLLSSGNHGHKLSSKNRSDRRK